MVASSWPRRFVPENIDLAEFSNLEPMYRGLLERSLDTAAEGEKWLVDYSELTSVVDEYGNRRYIDKSCHTDDPAIEKAFLKFVEEIEPRVKPLAFASFRSGFWRVRRRRSFSGAVRNAQAEVAGGWGTVSGGECSARDRGDEDQ